MPGWGDGPSTSTGDLDQAAATLPVSQGERWATQVGDAFTHGIDQVTRTVSQIPGSAEMGQEYAYDQTLDPNFLTPRPKISSDDANQRYGVPGYLRFNGPVEEGDAAMQQNMAYQRQFSDEVLTHSNADALSDIGASLLGGLVDPVNITLAAASDGFGDAAVGALGLGEAADTGLAVTRIGRLSRAAMDPLTYARAGLSQVPFVAGTAALSNAAGDQYDFGDALRDMSIGAVLHTSLHAAGILADGLNPSGLDSANALAAARSQLAELRGEPAAPPGAPEIGPAGDFNRDPTRADLMRTSALTPWVPDAVEALPTQARLGAWALALDRASSDEPVDIGGLVARALAPPALDRLDERSALTDIPSFRPGADDTAVTTRGTEVPVRYGLAELGDLTTSHTDDWQPNPAYPPELQPRDRGRAGAMARNLQLEAELNPKLLMSDVGAGAGAPIVAPDGVVESGNGRTIALRRAAAKGSDAYGRYRAALEAAGYDTTGMRNPALVRVRTEPLTGAQRSGLAHEMNADVTERMSAGEQAMADAARLPPNAFDLVEDGRTPATSRGFARAFLDRVGGDQAGAMTDREGRLSPEGARRIKAAVLAKAYGDPRLVGQVFEGEESPARRFGEALADAAPAWAKMRAAAAALRMPPELDLTPALTSAMDLVRFAAREGEPLGRLLAERLGQRELFGGETISPATEALLRLMYRDEAMTRPLAADKIAAALKDYARRAAAIEPGRDLLGEVPDETTARAILADAARKFASGDAGELETLRPPGRSSGEQSRPPVLDLRRSGEPGERADGGVSAQGGDGAEGAGAADAGAGGTGGRLTGDAIVSGDPELRALADDTRQLAETAGVDAPELETERPDTIAEAMRAAAVCLAEEA